MSDTPSHLDADAGMLSLVPGVPPVSGFSREPEGPGGSLLVRGGSLRGKALDELGATLEQAMTSPHDVVRLDLSAVSDWSTLAQAMVLHSARVLDRRGARLVLVGASEDLRLQSRWLDVFERIDSED
jgi:anti-anti-sigma regulatory factor